MTTNPSPSKITTPSFWDHGKWSRTIIGIGKAVVMRSARVFIIPLAKVVVPSSRHFPTFGVQYAEMGLHVISI